MNKDISGQASFFQRAVALVRTVLQRKSYLLLVVAVFALIGISLILVFQLRPRLRQLEAETLFLKASQHLDAEKTLQAYRYFAKASDKAPANAVYAREAALAAWDEELRQNARRYALRAWKNGTRQFEVLRVIVKSSASGEASLPPEQKLELFEAFAEAGQKRSTSGSKEVKGVVEKNRKRALALFRETVPEKAKWVRRGDVYYLLGEKEKAVDLWLEGLENKPRPDVVSKVVNRYIATEQFDAARDLLEQYRERDLIDGQGLGLLVGLYTRDNKFEAIPELIRGAKKSDRYDTGLRLDHAISLLIQGRNREARTVLEGAAATAEKTAVQSNEGTIEREKPSYPDALSGGDDMTHTHTRLFLAYLYFQQNDRAALQNLREQLESKEPARTRAGELEVYSYLLKKLESGSASPSSLASARQLIPGQAVIELLYARAALTYGAIDEALKAARNVTGLLSHWPPVVVTLVRAYVASGQTTKAVERLQAHHRRGLATPTTLRYYRDLAAKTGQHEVARKTQQQLERLSPDDLQLGIEGSHLALKSGDYDGAARILDQLAEKFPNENEVKLARIAVLLRKGNYEGVLQAAQENDVPAEEVAPLKAVAHIERHEWKAAESALARVMETASPRPLVRLLYGQTLLRLGKLTAASKQFQKLLEVEQLVADAHLRMAEIANRQEDWTISRQHAKKYLESTLEDAPNRALAHRLAAWACFRLLDNETAMNHASKGLQLESEPPASSLRHLVGLLHRRQGDHERAIRTFRRLVEADPENPRFLAALVETYAVMDKPQTALSQLRRHASAEPGPSLKLLESRLLTQTGQLDAAAQVLRSIRSKVSPIKLAVAKARIEKTRENWNGVVSLLEPYYLHPEAIPLWAEAKIWIRESELLLEILREEAKLSLEEWLRLGGIGEQADAWELARYCYAQARRLAPDNPRVLNNWAWASLHLPDWDEKEVLEACRQANKRLERSLQILDTYALALRKSGKYQECVRVLRDEMSFTLKTPQLLWHLGNAYEALKDWENAKRIYEICQRRLESGSSAPPTQQQVAMQLEEVERRVE